MTPGDAPKKTQIPEGLVANVFTILGKDITEEKLLTQIISSPDDFKKVMTSRDLGPDQRSFLYHAMKEKLLEPSMIETFDTFKSTLRILPVNLRVDFYKAALDRRDFFPGGNPLMNLEAVSDIYTIEPRGREEVLQHFLHNYPDPNWSQYDSSGLADSFLRIAWAGTPQTAEAIIAKVGLQNLTKWMGVPPPEGDSNRNPLLSRLARLLSYASFQDCQLVFEVERAKEKGQRIIQNSKDLKLFENYIVGDDDRRLLILELAKDRLGLGDVTVLGQENLNLDRERMIGPDFRDFLQRSVPTMDALIALFSANPSTSCNASSRYRIFEALIENRVAFTTAEAFAKLLEQNPPQFPSRIFKKVIDKNIDVITSAEVLAQALSKMDDPKMVADVYKKIRANRPAILGNTEDLSKVLRVIQKTTSPSIHAAVYNAERDQRPSIIQSRKDLSKLLKATEDPAILADVYRTEVNRGPSLIRSTKHLSQLLLEIKDPLLAARIYDGDQTPYPHVITAQNFYDFIARIRDSQPICEAILKRERSNKDSFVAKTPTINISGSARPDIYVTETKTKKQNKLVQLKTLFIEAITNMAPDDVIKKTFDDLAQTANTHRNRFPSLFSSERGMTESCKQLIESVTQKDNPALQQLLKHSLNLNPASDKPADFKQALVDYIKNLSRPHEPDTGYQSAKV